MHWRGKVGGWWIRRVKVGECGGLEGEVGRIVELRTTVGG
jgi:hypothetical protein